MGHLTNPNKRHSRPPKRRPAARRPPPWADWLLSQFSPPGMEDELQGDLLEMYAYWVKTVGVRGAHWRYVWAVLRVIRPFALFRPQPMSTLNLIPLARLCYSIMLKLPGATLVRTFAYRVIAVILGFANS
ncbi:permease prefix domain 2-containing transporter [Spirosoma gilvum]